MSHDHFCTPPKIVDRLHRFCEGPVGLDPCTNNRSIIKSQKAYAAGALQLSWLPPASASGERTAFENPPYSGGYLDLFTEKGVLERREHGFELIRLVPVCTSTAWWAKAMGKAPCAGKVYADAPSQVFTKRLSFIGLDGRIERDSARFDSVLFYYGHRHARFLEIFGEPEICNVYSEAPAGAPGPQRAQHAATQMFEAGAFRTADKLAQERMIGRVIDAGYRTAGKITTALAVVPRDGHMVDNALRRMKIRGTIHYRSDTLSWYPATPTPTNGAHR